MSSVHAKIDLWLQTSRHVIEFNGFVAQKMIFGSALLLFLCKWKINRLGREKKKKKQNKTPLEKEGESVLFRFVDVLSDFKQVRPYSWTATDAFRR